jgi:hypothetical protein
MWVGGQRHTPGTHHIGGWMDPDPAWMGEENLSTTGIRSPHCTTRSEIYPTPYGLSYTHDKVLSVAKFVYHNIKWKLGCVSTQIWRVVTVISFCVL